MFEGLWARSHAVRRRAGRIERRELREFRRWVEHTSNLVHLSVLLFVPLLIGVVTWLSGTVEQLSFLLFPPLASGTYVLFSNPQGRYSSPRKFVGGLTVGALCGWVALELSARWIYGVPPTAFEVAPAGAALGVLLTAIAVWALDVEEPSAFSTALLVLVTTTAQIEYVLSVAVSSTIVAAAFVGWRELVYDQRAEYLYQSVTGDDHVLVPMRGEHAETTAMFAARLAAAHRAGRVVLLTTVDEAVVADTERQVRSGEDEPQVAVTDGDGRTDEAVAEQAVAERATAELREVERRIEDELDVPCEIAVAVGEERAGGTILQTARTANCDLVVVPYEEADGKLAPHIRRVFHSDTDAIAFRSVRERAEWKRLLVPVRRAGDVAHSMLDFARRLAGDAGWVSVCSCITSGSERRDAERMLADLVETVECPCEIHVAHAAIEEYLGERAPAYDLVVMGASTDRSAASRFVSPPTFSRLHDLDCDVAVVHRG